jgi:hypothetical protein
VIAEPGRFFSSLCVSSYTAIIGKRKVPVSDIIKEGEAAGGDQHPNGFR